MEIVPGTSERVTDPSEAGELERLRRENAALRQQVADLETLMEMTSEHSDDIEAELQARVNETLRESEQRFRLITEAIPVPIFIARRNDGGIQYANAPGADLIGVQLEDIPRTRIHDFFSQADLDRLFRRVDRAGGVEDLDIHGYRRDGGGFYASVFVRAIRFEEKPCLLTVCFDRTERRRAQAEIDRLKKELADRIQQREGKYLAFFVAGEVFAIPIQRVRSIIQPPPVTRLPELPPDFQGVINNRGAVLPLADMRRVLALDRDEPEKRPCVIIAELGGDSSGRAIGLAVDGVSEVLSIRGRDVADPPPESSGFRSEILLGMARTGDDVIPLLDLERIFTQVPLPEEAADGR